MASNERSSLLDVLDEFESDSSDESDFEASPLYDTESTANTSAECGIAESVLSGLGRAEDAAISRPRASKLNPFGPRKRKRCGPSTRLCRKSLHECVSGNPDENLVVQSGILFCEACRTQVSPKASSLKRHFQTSRHQKGKEELKKQSLRQSSIAESLRRQDKAVYPQGETLPENERVYRIEAVETFLKAGVLSITP